MTEPAEQHPVVPCCFTADANKMYAELNVRDKKRIIALVLLLTLIGAEVNSWISLPIHESASALYIEFVVKPTQTIITMIEPVVFGG